MNLLYSIGTVLFGVHAGTQVKSPMFSAIANAAYTAAGIIKWAVLLFVLVKLTLLGFKIVTESKKSADALTLVKEQGLALFIGLAVTVGAGMIHSSMGEVIKNLKLNDKDTVEGWNPGNSDWADVTL